MPGGVLVTGGGSGIGAATARLLAARGTPVAINDIISERVTTVRESIESTGARAVEVPGDLSDERIAISVVDEAAERLGGLTGLVNNAAIVTIGSVGRAEASDWELIWRTNFMSAVFCTKAFVDGRGEGSAAIVNVASIAAFAPIQWTGPYAPMKAALVSLTQQTALEFGPSGVRVNAIAPNFISGTSMSVASDKNTEMQERRRAAVPLRRLGTTDEAASVIAFLLSDDAAYVTGQTILVDGGMSVSLMDHLPLGSRQVFASKVEPGSVD